MGRPEPFIEGLLRELFGADSLSQNFVVERTHMSLGPHPPPGANPRPIIARLLNYRDRDMILHLAREKALVTHQGSVLILS